MTETLLFPINGPKSCVQIQQKPRGTNYTNFMPETTLVERFGLNNLFADWQSRFIMEIPSSIPETTQVVM